MLKLICFQLFLSPQRTMKKSLVAEPNTENERVEPFLFTSKSEKPLYMSGPLR